MKKIIRGKLYNTETSTLIAEYWNGYERNNFLYFSETLYRTKKGNWFLHKSGGAMTICRCRCFCDSFCGGESIVPLPDDDAARQWLEKYADAETYTRFFEPEEA